jgi:hypothetical protein
MAAIFIAVDEGLKRITGILPASQEYVTTVWWHYIPAWPSSGVIRTLYMIANSTNRSGESIIIAQNDTGEIYLNVAGVKKTGQIFPPGWHSIMLRRRANVNFIDMDIDNDSTSVSTATVVFNTWTFNEVYLGVDPRINGAAAQVAYFREWPLFMSPVTEWQSPTPVQTSSLDTNTPLHTDLLDTTVNDHDWTYVGVGTLTFTSLGGTIEGTYGAWWSMSSLTVASNLHKCILMARTADYLGDTAGRTIVRLKFEPQGAIYDGDLNKYTAVNYKVILYYGILPTSTDATTSIEVANPVADPGINKSEFTVLEGPRSAWHVTWRFAITFKCSTYSSTTATFASDGYVKVYLNDSLLLEAASIVLPRVPGGHGLEYTLGMRGDCDRAWARTIAGVPVTDAEGNFTAGTPSGLVFSDDFNSGLYPDWTVSPALFEGGGGGSPIPYAYSDCGGDGGYGLSAHPVSPSTATGPTETYTGIYRHLRFPPYDPVIPPPGEPPPIEPPPTPPDLTGIFVLYPGPPVVPPTNPKDNYPDRNVPPGPTGTISKKIPNPTIKTALLGE